MTEHQIGKLLDEKFLLESVLGEGGMGTVFRAQHLQLKREIALKVLHPHLLADDRSRQRFLQEARAISTLDHPNIVRVSAFGNADGYVYIAMDLLTGQSLAQKLKAQGKLSVEESTRYVTMVAKALAHAHSHGIIHRDIKPSNIILEDRNGQETVQVVDFGVAKFIGPDSNAQSLTRTGVAIGTPQYMSPEQCANQQVDARSDIYSLGCVLYELLSGHPPFQNAESSFAAMFEHMHGEVAALPSGVPSWLQSITMKCLAKAPAERFQTMDELCSVLEQRTSIPIARANQEKAKQNANRKVVIWGVAAATAVACISAFFVFTGNSIDPHLGMSEKDEVETKFIDVKRKLADVQHNDQLYPKLLLEKANLRRRMYELTPERQRETYQLAEIVFFYNNVLGSTEDIDVRIQAMLERSKTPGLGKKQASEDIASAVTMAQQQAMRIGLRHEPGDLQHYVSIATEALKRLPQSTDAEVALKQDMVVQQIGMLIELGMLSDAKNACDQWLSFFRSSKYANSRFSPEVTALTAYVALHNADIKRAAQLYKEAYELAEEKEKQVGVDKVRLSHVYSLYSRFQNYIGERKAAVEAGRKAVELLRNSKLPPASVADAQADVLQAMFQGNFPPDEILKLDHLVRAEYQKEMKRDSHIWERMAWTYRLAGDVNLLAKNDLSAAWDEFTSGYEIASQIPTPELRAELQGCLLNGQAHVLLAQGKLADAHKRITQVSAVAKGWGVLAEAYQIDAAAYQAEGKHSEAIAASLKEFNTRLANTDLPISLCTAAVRTAGFYAAAGDTANKQKWIAIAKQYAEKSPDEGKDVIKRAFGS